MRGKGPISLILIYWIKIFTTRNVPVGHGCPSPPPWQCPITNVKLATSQNPVFTVISMSCCSLCMGMNKIHQWCRRSCANKISDGCRYNFVGGIKMLMLYYKLHVPLNIRVSAKSLPSILYSWYIWGHHSQTVRVWAAPTTVSYTALHSAPKCSTRVQ